MLAFFSASIRKKLFRSGVEYLMSLGLMNHTVIEQELNVQVQLTQVNVQRLLLESFTNRQVVNFLLNERLVLDKLPTDGLGNDVFTS
jgi:hypothetical protein